MVGQGKPMEFRAIRRSLLIAGLGVASACATVQTPLGPEQSDERAGARLDALPLLNRVTWGANAHSAHALAEAGIARYLDRQLQPGPRDLLPPEAQAHIDAMTISQR